MRFTPVNLSACTFGDWIRSDSVKVFYFSHLRPSPDAIAFATNMAAIFASSPQQSAPKRKIKKEEGEERSAKVKKEAEAKGEGPNGCHSHAEASMAEFEAGLRRGEEFEESEEARNAAAVTEDDYCEIVEIVNKRPWVIKR